MTGNGFYIPLVKIWRMVYRIVLPTSIELRDKIAVVNSEHGLSGSSGTDGQMKEP